MINPLVLHSAAVMFSAYYLEPQTSLSIEEIIKLSNPVFQVISVIKRQPEVQKISFVAHSLGGLIARFTIGKLYRQNITRESFEENGECRNAESGAQYLEVKSKGKIAGLEPINFITFATPHLGSIGHKQVPYLQSAKLPFLFIYFL